MKISAAAQFAALAIKAPQAFDFTAGHTVGEIVQSAIDTSTRPLLATLEATAKYLDGLGPAHAQMVTAIEDMLSIYDEAEE